MRRHHLLRLVAALVALSALLAPVDTVSATSRQTVVVGSGRLSGNRYEWSARVYRGRGNHAAERPCIDVEVAPVDKSTPAAILEAEGAARCSRPRTDYPNIISVVDELSARTLTVVGMAFPLAANSVTLYFSGSHPTAELRLRALSNGQAREAGLKAFKYAAIGFAGGSCIDRFIVRAPNGRILDDGGRMHCHN